jgi:ribonucleoside-diphosphate reductase alpha chain
MYRSISLEEDLALKKVITDRAASTDNADRFDWRAVLGEQTVDRVPQILVTRGKEEEELSLAKVADTIGIALTDLLISRQEQEEKIFNEENRNFVSNVANNVAKSLTEQVHEGGQLRLTRNDLYLLIEKALIENDAHDVAKSLVFSRSLEKNGEVIVSEEPQTMPVRLIRRNGNVVPWSQTKIEIAVRKAFLSIKEDPEAAVRVAHGVTESIRNGDSAFAHIENVQDLVQEELMRQGYFKAAEAYILYRARRAQ